MRPSLWNQLSQKEQGELLASPRARSSPGIGASVRKIVGDVRQRGWSAVCSHAARLDGRAPECIGVAPYAQAARRRLTSDQIEAIELAVRNIATFHEAVRPSDADVELTPGLRVRKVWRAIDRIGLYVPGGSAPLFSTLLMLALPAKIAGVAEIVVVTPPRSDGGLDPVLALAAELSGIDAIWTLGGPQAIAALAFGAGAIAPVSKICGPGNAYVNEAKLYVAQLPGGPAIDMPAGPSELMVIADDSADPEFVAADLLSQAEHDVAAQVVLATNSTSLADCVEGHLIKQISDLPRATIARPVLEHAPLILVDALDVAVDIANLYAPEHLSLAVGEPERLLAKVRNAGAVFLGSQSAESFGDYLAGSSHVLPTDGAARAWSGVTVQTFMKAITVQEIEEQMARDLAAPAAALARLEGLEAHARAAELRSTNSRKAAA